MVDAKAFHSMSYGLYIISSVGKDGKKCGCVVNTFQQVASTPPMVSVSLNKQNATTAAIQETGKFTATVLSQEATMELIGTFGFKCSTDVDKFAGIAMRETADGLPVVLEKASAVFEVEVKQSIDACSHIVFVGEVIESEMVNADIPPMTYAYYHSDLKGKTPPKAASFDPYADKDLSSTENVAPLVSDDEPKAGVRYGWRCQLCGYIVEVDELPDDFVCPICGVGKDMFERIEL